MYRSFWKKRITLKAALSILMGVLFFFAISEVSPYEVEAGEAVIFKSSLVWRADGKGDYLLPQLRNRIYESAGPVPTEGYIKSITANWEFKGKVTLKVSVDNGLNYTPLVNGVPMDYEGGVKGNQIKWMAMPLDSGSELAEVRIVYADTSGVKGSFGEPELSGFQFRKPIYINNPSGETLFNYQINLKIASGKIPERSDAHCEGKISPEFTGIRFTAADGDTLLPYWRESVIGIGSGQFASFWVKIPQIPSEGLSVYIYYGNDEAKDLSSGEEVFDFFDDFKGEALDTGKWDTYIELEGSADIIDYRLKLDSARIVSKEYEIKDGIIEYQGTMEAGGETRLIIRTEEPGQGEGLTQIAYSSSFRGAEHSIAIGNIVRANEPKPILSNTRYNYRVTARGTSLLFERYGEDFREKQALISFEDEGGLTAGYVGLKTGPGNISYYDWIRVRKFVRFELVINSSGKEEPVSLARFSGTALAENGDIIRGGVLEGDGEAIYISGIIPAPYPARIMIPSWHAAEDILLVDISADGGKAYKRNCKNNTYYYASRKDFISGDRLKFRVRLPGASASTLAEISVSYRPGNILLISPNGGEAWSAGTPQKILWLATEYEPAYPMKIEYSIDSGKTYTVIRKRRKNIGVYFWKVPRRLSGKKILIKLSDALEEGVYDASDGTLEIR